MEIQFTTQIFKEGRAFVAHTRELDVSSCGETRHKALQNLKEVVRLFLEEAGKMGTMEQILAEAGYLKRKNKLQGPKFIATSESPCRYRWNMPKLSPVSYGTLTRIFEADGFRCVRTEGDHMVFKNPAFSAPS